MQMQRASLQSLRMSACFWRTGPLLRANELKKVTMRSMYGRTNCRIGPLRIIGRIIATKPASDLPYYAVVYTFLVLPMYNYLVY